MILWELITETEPFQGISKEELYQIVAIEGFRPSIENVPRELAEIIFKCWNPDPFKRPNFVDITEMLEEIKL